MKGKRDHQKADQLLIATRVSPETKAGFEKLAAAEDRSVSAQLRRLIERTVKEA